MYIFAHAGQKKCNIFVRQKSVIVALSASILLVVEGRRQPSIFWKKVLQLVLFCTNWCGHVLYSRHESQVENWQKKNALAADSDQAVLTTVLDGSAFSMKMAAAGFYSV